MIKRIVLLLLPLTVFILSLSSPILASEPGNGIIEGLIINMTAGGSNVADQEITLNIYLNGAEVDTVASMTDYEGQFIFEGLSTAPGYGYEIVANFQRVEYKSERLNFDDGEIAKYTEVIIYDSTTNDEAIKIAMSHMIIYVEEDILLVKEYYLLVNEADRTYIGASGEVDTEVLYFSLPEGATELQPTMGLMDCCIVMNENGFTDIMPALPGMKEVGYSYRLHPDSGTFTFSQMIHYPINRLDVLVQDGDIQVASNQLSDDEPMHINDIHYEHLSGQDFAAGDTLVMRLSGLPRTETQGIALWVLLAVLVIGISFVFIFLMKKKRLQPVSDEGSLNLHKQQLLDELAELDDNFEDGNISEEAYRKLRAEKKAELIAQIHKSEEE